MANFFVVDFQIPSEAAAASIIQRDSVYVTSVWSAEDILRQSLSVLPETASVWGPRSKMLEITKESLEMVYSVVQTGWKCCKHQHVLINQQYTPSLQTTPTMETIFETKGFVRCTYDKRRYKTMRNHFIVCWFTEICPLSRQPHEHIIKHHYKRNWESIRSLGVE